MLWFVLRGAIEKRKDKWPLSLSCYSRSHQGSHVARISVWSRVLHMVFVPKKNIVVLTFWVVIHFSGESASLLVEKRQDGSEPHAINDEANERAVEEEESRRLKSNHVSLLERNERQFYDNLLVSRNDSWLFIDNPGAFLASVLPISAHYYLAARKKQNAPVNST